MVAPIVFQPTLLDCWACRDFKRFRQVLKGGGAIVVHPAQQGEVGKGKGKGKSNGAEDADDAGALSSSQPRSPGYSWGSAGNSVNNGPCPPSEVNRRDHLGRTVLHLLAASLEPASIDYLTVLLAHPSVNVNLQDQENGWTALHRALYHGNLLTALTLLKRSPAADHRVKDLEGLTAFDLYNSTIHGTNPTHGQVQNGELFTWGANRNSTLGLGTSDDRALPDRRTLRREDVFERSGTPSEGEARTDGDAQRHWREPGARFDRVSVEDVGMSKFATVVRTSERANNVWVCGIGTNGRIGRAPQTQAFLEPLRDFSDTAKQISVGPDHTCIVTDDGDVYTFGYNRFQQLGYPLEHGFGTVSSSSRGGGGAAVTTFGGASIPTSELDVQVSPRKVLGALKKEMILGAAAGKLHTAAFTSDSLYTWGTNTGQLGYDRAATATQINPRKVTMIPTGTTIVSVAVSDFATACLTVLGDVFLLHNDSFFFVRFPQMTPGSSVYRPRQARPKPAIQTIVGGPNNAFAAISDIGEVWQFSAGHPSEYAQPSGTSSAAKAMIKPQLIWSVRKNKKVGAARDVAMGNGSDMIITTESGHVFVRQKKADASTTANQQSSVASSSTTTSVKGKSGWKAVPYLQRIVKVATNESGGLAAIKADAAVRHLRIRGRALDEDLRDALPHLRAKLNDEDTGKEGERIVGDLADAVTIDTDAVSSSDEEDSDVDKTGSGYIRIAQTMAEAARRWAIDEANSKMTADKIPPLGCDMFVFAGGRYLPAHRSIVSARLPNIAPYLEHPPGKGGSSNIPAGVSIRQQGAFVILTLPTSSFGAALFLLHYLYTDDIPAIWAASIGMRVEKSFSRVKISPVAVQTQLRTLAESLGLDALLPTLSSTVPRAPRHTLSDSMQVLFDSHVVTPAEQSPFHDVLLHLSDRDVPAHSVILRRSPFFSAFFQPQWTSTRWTRGVIEINMRHVRWEVASLILLHLYTDKLTEVFHGCDEDRTADQYIDFIVEVMAFSNELLLDKFKLACCALLRQRILPANVAAMLTDADFYNATGFKGAIMDYSACTMETLLEAGMLDELEVRMIKDLGKHVRMRQDERLKRTQADDYLSALIVKHQDYYFDLDIPAPSLGIVAARVPRRQPRASERHALSPQLQPQKGVTPAMSRVQGQRGASISALTSPDLRPTGSNTPSKPTTQANRGDESMMFSMDDLNDAGRSPRDAPNGGLREIDDAAEFSLPPSKAGAAPWKSRSAEASKVIAGQTPPREASAAASPAATPLDLRSIMASEQSRTRAPTISTASAAAPAEVSSQQAATPAAAARLSQKDRKKQQTVALTGQASAASAMPAPASQAPAGSPWKTVETPAAPITTMPNTPTRPSLLGTHSSQASRQGTPTPAALPAMGPMITPQRMRPSAQPRLSSGTGRDAGSAQTWTSSAVFGSSPAASSGGPIWNTPTSPPSGPPAMHAAGPRPSMLRSEGGRRSSGFVASTPPADVKARASPASQPSATDLLNNAPPKSFAEIQAEELRRYEQMMALQQARAPRSFAELQEEDRLEGERRRADEQRARDFEREFAEESKRVQAEQRKKAAKTGKKPNAGVRKDGKAAGSRGAETGVAGANGNGQTPSGSKKSKNAKAGGEQKARQATKPDENAQATGTGNSKPRRRGPRNTTAKDGGGNDVSTPATAPSAPPAGP